jgi:signal transduction histidine kinase
MTETERCASRSGTGRHRVLRVLLVEDSPEDALLLMHALGCGGFHPVYERVDTRADMEAQLERQSWDVVLADHAMPEFSAPEALECVKRRGLDVPFIIVSGHIEEETAVAAMNAGAHDYIMKDRLARLAPAVERELREAEVRRARRQYESELRRAQEELEVRVEQRTADLKAANSKLHKVIEERKRLENELLEIAENERRRIGFDLHDDLGQKLAGLALMIKGLEQRLTHDHHPAIEEARRIQSLISDITQHTHNLARQFSSLDLHGDDLSAVLKELAANVRKVFGITCALSVKGAVPPLPANCTQQFYKIAQEAVSNAIKHGKAAHVSVCLSKTAEHLLLTIKNDGVPFAPSESKGRMGLRIMNYRANTIGASFEIKPNHKSGAIVTCCLPLKNGAKPPVGRVSRAGAAARELAPCDSAPALSAPQAGAY